jgi:hypothetical protein
VTAFCSSNVPSLVQSAKASTVSLFIYQKSSKVLKEGSRRVFNNNNPPQTGIWVWVHRAKFLCPRNLWKAVRVCNNNNNTTSTGISRVHVDQSREAPLQSHACEISRSTRGEWRIHNIYFHLQKLQVGPVDAVCRERQYATKNRARTKFLRKIWRINPGFCAPHQRSYSQIFKIVCTSSIFNTFHAINL